MGKTGRSEIGASSLTVTSGSWFLGPTRRAGSARRRTLCATPRGEQGGSEELGRESLNETPAGGVSQIVRPGSRSPPTTTRFAIPEGPKGCRASEEPCPLAPSQSFVASKSSPGAP